MTSYSSKTILFFIKNKSSIKIYYYTKTPLSINNPYKTLKIKSKSKKFPITTTSNSLKTLTSFSSNSTITKNFTKTSNIKIFDLIKITTLFLTKLFLISFSNKTFLKINSTTNFISFLNINFKNVPLLKNFSSKNLKIFFNSTFTFDTIYFKNSINLTLYLSTILFKSNLKR